jgi:hypothetical protein
MSLTLVIAAKEFVFIILKYSGHLLMGSQIMGSIAKWNQINPE